MAEQRFRSEDLRTFATQVLTKAGLPEDRARVVAGILVEGDLLGQTTHGLNLMTPYMASIEEGSMTMTGEPTVVSDLPGAFAWDGNFLPGAWLVTKAMEQAMDRVKTQGVVSAAVCRTHHIGALQAYLKTATDKGLVMTLMTSDPREESVAPHGGVDAKFSPNPIAFGVPTQGDPILVDVSMSATTNGMVNRLYKEGKQFANPWLQDGYGNPTTDPNVRFSEPKGAIYPVGGPSSGHKGFGMGFMVEMLTSALAGHGRNTKPTRWGGNIYIQIIDPAAFGGLDTFTAESTFFAAHCKASPAPEGRDPVRMPGDGELARRAEQNANGVELYGTIEADLKVLGDKLGIAMPDAI